MEFISNSNFLIKVPPMNPYSLEYREFWKEQKRRCIDGYWVSGKYMPGPLYFYVNFWMIKLKKDKGKGEYIGKPLLRDLEWEKAYIFLEARGFSGFEFDVDVTCDRMYAPSVRKTNEELGVIEVSNVRYVPARDHLRAIHAGDMGRPIFNNQAKNVIDIECRGGGKSYFCSGAMIGWNFLFDGATSYEEYRQGIESGELLSSETLVGAIHSSYSKDLLSKVQLGMDNLIGAVSFNSKLFPSPLAKTFQGSFATAKYVEAVRKIKVGNNWDIKGSRSKIHHRTFGDNPFAGNGTRPGFTALEEVGFFYNLEQTLGALKEVTYNGANKFGTIWMFGTGGDMEGGSTFEAQKIFYNPEAYDCLLFDDEWEGRGNIGYFVPAWRGLNQFKDNEGVTNKELALRDIEAKREQAKKAPTPKPYNDELQNRPLKPSEAFLTIEGNFFPVKDLKLRYEELMASKKILDASMKVDLEFAENGDIRLKFVNEHKLLRDFPVKNNQSTDGCIEIFEPPKRGVDGKIPYGLYIAGTDPYDDDHSTTTSLGSTFIMNRLTDRIVAEYTGRPSTAREYYENVRRLLLFYNATCNYENNKKGMFAYFENKNSLYLLSDTPYILKDMEIIKEIGHGNKAKGTNASQSVNSWARELSKDWMLHNAYDKPEGVNNIQTIRSIGLLLESIMWNPEGNFDRISALGMLMILRENMFKRPPSEGGKKIYTLSDSEFFEKNYRKQLIF